MATHCFSRPVDRRDFCGNRLANSSDAMVGIDILVRRHVHRDLARGSRLRADLGMVCKRNRNGYFDTNDVRLI